MLPTNGDFESNSGSNKIMYNSHVAIREIDCQNID